MTPGDRDAARRAVDEVPGIPRDADGPTFSAPWEARAFAIVLALHERGAFTWPEWTTALGAEIGAPGDAGPSPGDFYRHWVSALERMVERTGVADLTTLERHREAWRRASDRTPHGSPLVLLPEDFPAEG
ncbi:MAG: nitrile hydratase accessory protein [Actinomycetota bacterium]